MIEPIMYLSIGFLVAMLFGLLLLPLVHNRAVRLTLRKVEAATPLSMTEIQADKDQLRAEFAMTTRKLETSIEELRAKSAAQAAEIGKKTDAIARMKIEIDEKTTAIFALETRDRLHAEKLAAVEAELEATSAALKTAEASLAARQAEVQAMSADVAGLAALNQQLAAWTDRANTAEEQLAAAREELAAQRATAETATKALNETRTRNEVLTGRVSELDRQVSAHRQDAEAFRQQVQAIENELAARAATLASRESEIANLRHALDESRTMITTMRNELSAKAGRALTVERLRNEKAEAEQAMRVAQDERAQALRELAIRSQAESSWEVDRMENALLRERIDDIASEVARLAVSLEGPDGTIAKLLADEVTDDGMPASLASRIRAIEAGVARPQA